MKRFLKNRLAVILSVLFLVFVIACLLAPLLTSYKYETISRDRLLDPCRGHILGTDNLGRDLFTRILYGGRVTLGVTLSAVLISLIGIVPGLLAGYFGGWADNLLSRIDDAVSAVPTFLLVIFAECLFGWGAGGYRYAIGIALIPPVTKLTRSLVQNVMSGEYIEAAKVLGVPDTVILFRHVLRNILPSLIVFMFHTAADALMLCTVTGYLGIGVQPPKPELGMLVHAGYKHIFTHPLQTVIPCIPVLVSILALKMAGNAVRDALDTERTAG